MSRPGAMPGAGATPPEPMDAPLEAEDMAEEEAPDTVVATILKSADGVYKLQIGEEPEEPMGGEGDPTGGLLGEATKAPQTFDPGTDGEAAIGRLLVAVKDALETDSGGGEGVRQSNFKAGYDGKAAA